MTNKITLKSAFVICALMTTTASAEELQNKCAIKAEKIQTQINYAKTYNNTREVAGLEKALAEVKEHCTDEKLTADLQNKIYQKEEKLAERQVELDEANAKGDPKKIAKKERKVLEAKQELAEAKQEFDSYHTKTGEVK